MEETEGDTTVNAATEKNGHLEAFSRHGASEVGLQIKTNRSSLQREAIIQ